MQELDPELKAERKKMQLEIILKDSDVKKNMRSKIEVETALRDLKHKESLIQMEIVSKENQLKKIEADAAFMQNELIKLKRKMNSLGR
ncbi:MAG TPA: hypothetical protein PLB52_03940 [Candidatus Moranbacteria bacterium]|nr:hypothetical protein [Candidatus Moranbacteria bacterium]